MHSEFLSETEPQKETAQALEQSGELVQRLIQVSPSKRQALLVAYLQEHIAKAIGINASQIDVQQPLNYMGIDSLIAVNLRNQLRADLEVDIPVVQFMEGSSVVSLAMQASEQLINAQSNSVEADFKLHKPSLNEEKTQSYPLSHGQQGLWFLYQLAPKSAAYNVAFTARICSDLNIAALKRAFNVLIVRHPTLRSTFGQQGSEPFQKVHENQEVCFEEIDASTWNPEKLTQSVVKAYQRPFDLERGSVLRVHLWTRSARDRILLLTIHHIAVDGFSFGILLKELRLLYQAENTGQSLSLPPVKWQYRDFVQWQQNMLSTPVGDNLWSYWQKQLADELPVLKLPTDRPRPPIQNYQGASYIFELDKELTSKLREVAKTFGTTLYTTLLAAFQVLLHRYTSQDDIIVGSPTEGRSQSEFARTIGFFVNMLALRVNLAGNPTFSEILTQVRQTVLGAIAHQDYPAQLLIERLHINRDPSLPGLFRVSFNLLKLQEIAEDYELSVSDKTKIRLNWGGLSLEPFVIPQQEGQNDLVFDMMETTASLLGIIRYNTDLFDATTISRMADHFQTLLLGIIANPQERISALPLLTTAEQYQLLQEWNNTQVEFPQDKCIHELFEAQVELTKDALAVVFNSYRLTYRELNERANQLARYLQALGVGPEVLVGICVERSVEMVVGLLGILKAGGAYLPLDSAYPRERLLFMLEDARVSFVISHSSLVDSFEQMTPNKRHMTIVCIDKDWEVISQQSKTNLVNVATPQNLAYVVYTSGSTGKSKGVAIAHRNLVNAYQGWEKAYQLKTLTSHLQMASFSFDVFSGDLVRALCSGAKLVLCPREWLLEPEKLYKLMQEEKVDSAEFFPGVLRNLVRYLEKTEQSFHFMRLLVVGSDSLYVKDYEDFQRLCSSETRVYNSYGVSEATIDSTYFESTKVNLSVDGLVPIGRPFANTQIYILDRYLQPVPIGIPGELHIGGVGVARNYLNQSQLSEEKFIPNPFENPQSTIQNPKSVLESLLRRETLLTTFRKIQNPKSNILYKTGDLARYLSDGNIEFLGRIDNQVKIRGFRIELAEIEAVLSQYQKVRETVVMIRDERSNNKRVVAYIVPKEQLNTSELQQFLKQKLPNFMVPSAFVMLDKLPLLPNGKVDRQALPLPDKRPDIETTYVTPQTETECLIATVWQQTLQVEKVGIDDNFFELGGHSLLQVEIYNKLQKIFTQELSVVDLFKYPTIRYLAKYLSQNENEINVYSQSKNRAEIRSDRKTAMNQQSQVRQKHRFQKK